MQDEERRAHREREKKRAEESTQEKRVEVSGRRRGKGREGGGEAWRVVRGVGERRARARLHPAAGAPNDGLARGQGGRCSGPGRVAGRVTLALDEVVAQLLLHAPAGASQRGDSESGR
jgi:hypothetical protein